MSNEQLENMFEKLKLSATTAVNIEWEMTPDLAFCTFSAKGLRGDLTNTNERVWTNRHCSDDGEF